MNMGEVSYKLMQSIILRRLHDDLQDVVDKYRTKTELLDRNDPDYTLKALQYSNQMFDEMNKIQDETMNKYKKELSGIHGT
jgi:hypothetical protein